MSQMFSAGSQGRLKLVEAVVGSWVGPEDFPFITHPPSERP